MKGRSFIGMIRIAGERERLGVVCLLVFGKFNIIDWIMGRLAS